MALVSFSNENMKAAIAFRAMGKQYGVPLEDKLKCRLVKKSPKLSNVITFIIAFYAYSSSTHRKKFQSTSDAAQIVASDSIPYFLTVELHAKTYSIVLSCRHFYFL